MTTVGPLGAMSAAAVAWGVVLPVAVYLVVTWLTPLGGRGLGLQRAWPKAVMQAGILVAVIVLTLYRRVHGWVSGERADGSGGGAARVARIGRRIQGWALAVLAAVSLFPATWLYTSHAWGASLALAPLAVLAVSACAACGLAAWQWRSRATRWSDGIGRAAEPAILALGLAVLVLNIGARPLLFWEERRLAAQETLIQVDADMGGFTVVEARVAQDLRDGVLQAAAMLERPKPVNGKQSTVHGKQ